MYRDAEGQFKSALKHFSTIDMFLFLGKVYIKLDQPLSAVDYYKRVSVHILCVYVEMGVSYSLMRTPLK